MARIAVMMQVPRVPGSHRHGLLLIVTHVVQIIHGGENHLREATQNRKNGSGLVEACFWKGWKYHRNKEILIYL